MAKTSKAGPNSPTASPTGGRQSPSPPAEKAATFAQTYADIVERSLAAALDDLEKWSQGRRRKKGPAKD